MKKILTQFYLSSLLFLSTVHFSKAHPGHEEEQLINGIDNYGLLILFMVFFTLVIILVAWYKGRKFRQALEDASK